jgi:hypothetical protein
MFLTLTSLLLIYWSVDFFTHFTVKSKIHFVVTSVFVLYLTCQAVWFRSLLSLGRTGDATSSISIASIVISLAFRVFLLTTILLTAAGWCIVTVEFPLCAHIDGFAALVVHTLCYGVVNAFELGWSEIFAVLLWIATLGIYIRSVMKALDLTWTAVTGRLID